MGLEGSGVIQMSKKTLNSGVDFADEKNAIKILKTESEEAAYRRAKENEFNPLNLFKDVLGFLFVVAIAFGWMILMLLIISFVSLSYLHFNIDTMINISLVFAAIAGLLYILLKVKEGIKKKK